MISNQKDLYLIYAMTSLIIHRISSVYKFIRETTKDVYE